MKNYNADLWRLFLTGSEKYRLMVKLQAENISDSDSDRAWKLAELGKSCVKDSPFDDPQEYHESLA